ncbi:flagellar basal-body rod modification protein FlgD [Maritalea mobilis]|uniref:Basal-body rod modification protein FlgD n=1 Tax=Maritalea mobilis TaxID=483324 RepID=A0A4V3DBN2_9HYPH|nr:flagellar hook capping FlgD N-terminal domain-containing protein [Maritalea mobilis]TDQ67278.1 flagellar basal-body rod modification protein FlgD [Maritalea mobilis]
MVSPTSSVGSGAGAGQSELANSRKTIAENFDTFLSILTTQLKNQNPLDPLDTNQFTSQMVEFTGVEQQLKTNEYLEALINANQQNFASQAVSYIGKEVTAFSNQASLENSEAKWTYGMTQDAEEANITIKNSAGAVVFTEKTKLESGEHDYTWDGIANDGSIAPDGKYSIHIEATNADGGKIDLYTMTAGMVETVDFAGSEPILVVNGTKVEMSAVAKIGLPS